MRMKKMVALLLALVMVCSLASCGVLDQLEDLGVTDREFELGDIDGKNYENEFIGLGCMLDDEWTFHTEEQMRELNNIAEEILSDDFEEAVANAEIVYDMSASHSNQTDSINVNMEKVKASTLAKLDLSENFEAVFDMVKTEYLKLGYTNIEHEIGTVEIDGKEFTAMNITANTQTVTMYQTLIAVKCTGYLANIAITTAGEDRTDAILDRFYVVKDN